MAKLPSKKTKPGASLAVSKIKKGPKKAFKKNSTKNIASAASPKPTKATNSTKNNASPAPSPKPTKGGLVVSKAKKRAERRSKKALKKKNTQNNASPASPKPTKGGLVVSKAKKRSKRSSKKNNTQNNASPASPKPTNATNSTKNKASPASPKPSNTANTKPNATQMEKKNKKPYNPAKSQKKKRGRKAKKSSGSFPAKRDIILKRTRKPERVVDEEMMKKFSGQVKAVVKKGKKKRPEVVDPKELISVDMLEAAVGGLKKLPSTIKNVKKSFHDITDEDERFVYMQVTLCKLPKVTADFHLYGPTTVSVYLPHSLVTDNTDIILITKDLQRGIKRDHTNSLDHFKERLHAHEANALINEVIPLRQLKVEYKEYEARRLLANRVDVLLCDDTIMRFIPKFLGKHFYTKHKLPVQVNLKAKDLQKEVLRALSVSKLFFSMKGNSALMKVGRLSQTDEELRENVLAAVQKVATHAPGHWANVQGLGLKLQDTQSIPLYVNMESLNSVEPLPVKPLYPGEAVSGTLSTQPGKCITVYPDGTVTSMSIGRRTRPRLAKEAENVRIRTEEAEARRAKKNKQEKKSTVVAKDELPEAEEDSKSEAKKSSKRKGDKEKKSNKTKKQKKTHGSDSDSDSGEEDLEEQEMTYLRQLTQRKEEESGGAQEEEEEEEDVWGDSDSEMGESD